MASTMDNNGKRGKKAGGNKASSNKSADRASGNRQSDTSSRGFASMDPDKQREIASEGGRAAHEKGTAHEFTSEEARRAGSQSHKNDGNRQSASTGSRDNMGQGGDMGSGGTQGNQQNGGGSGSGSGGGSGSR